MNNHKEMISDYPRLVHISSPKTGSCLSVRIHHLHRWLSSFSFILAKQVSLLTLHFDTTTTSLPLKEQTNQIYSVLDVSFKDFGIPTVLLILNSLFKYPNTLNYEGHFPQEDN